MKKTILLLLFLLCGLQMEMKAQRMSREAMGICLTGDHWYRDTLICDTQYDIPVIRICPQIIFRYDDAGNQIEKEVQNFHFSRIITFNGIEPYKQDVRMVLIWIDSDPILLRRTDSDYELLESKMV